MKDTRKLICIKGESLSYQFGDIALPGTSSGFEFRKAPGIHAHKTIQLAMLLPAEHDSMIP